MSPEFKRILLAEDHANDLELTLAALRANRLVNEVIVVHEGAEALEWLFRRGRFSNRDDDLPALVLLDLKMRKVDGLEVLRQIKSDARMRLTPVVMLTASREEVDLDAVRQIGAFWAVVNETPPAVPTEAA